jgi:hypothetical protein
MTAVFFSLPTGDPSFFRPARGHLVFCPPPKQYIFLNGVASTESVGLLNIELAPLAYINPPFDTFRGGGFVTISSQAGLVTTGLDQSFQDGVPGTWPNLSINGGSVSRDGRFGVVLNAGAGTSGVAGLQSPSMFRHFDVAIDIDVIGPPHSVTPIDIASLELVSGLNVARVRIVQEGLVTTARGDLFLNGTQIPSGVSAVPSTATTLTLRLVRADTHLYGFIGKRDVNTGVYSELTQVLSYPTFPAGLGNITISTRNNGTTAGSRIRISNFTVRSSAAISYRLLDNKIDAEEHRLVGFVPAASLGLRALGILNHCEWV